MIMALNQILLLTYCLYGTESAVQLNELNGCFFSLKTDEIPSKPYIQELNGAALEDVRLAWPIML